MSYFFLYPYSSANVFGIGEIIEPYEEQLPSIAIITPPIKCSTPQIYNAYRSMDLAFCSKEEITKRLLYHDSSSLLDQFIDDPCYLNDLLPSCLQTHNKLSDYLQKGYFLSGSGSSLFYQQSQLSIYKD